MRDGGMAGTVLGPRDLWSRARRQCRQAGLHGNFRLARHETAISGMIKNLFESPLSLTPLRPQGTFVHHDRSGP